MIPIGDSPFRRRTPWVTYLLIAANLGVFIYMLSLDNTVPANPRVAQQQFIEQRDGICYGFETTPTEIDRFFCRWSFQPREWFDAVRNEPKVNNFNRTEVLLTILTSMFIHAGWLHIIGNMLFLWVFGDNVEDRMGRFGFLVFYIVAGMFATMVQGLIDPGSLVPTVGASGAVAGVLGSYLILFPTAVVFAALPFLFFIPIPVPAVLMIGLWFLQNLLSGIAVLGDVRTADTGVAWFAHLGGFGLGVVTGLFVRALLPQRRPPRPPPGQWGA